MYQFFVEPGQIQGKRVTITGSDVNHIKNVLRMRIGEEIAVSNGMDGLEYRCGIEEFLEDEVVCTLRFVKEDGLELPSRIYLFQALPKGDKMELVIQKAVELGAFAVIPVAAKRCVVKLDAKKEKNKLARWQGNIGGCGQTEQAPDRTGGYACDVHGGSAEVCFGNGCEAVSL